jgi:glucokinase
MMLAGVVGGTKTLLGVFERGEPRPAHLHLFRYSTTAFSSFAEQLEAFARDVGGMPRLAGIAVGVAGPVVGRVARLTNHSWVVDADKIAAHTGAPVTLLNDLEAMAYSVEVLTPDRAGGAAGRRPPPGRERRARRSGHRARRSGAASHRWTSVAAPSEAGHADFAARSSASGRWRRC